jgi:MFS family permease
VRCTHLFPLFNAYTLLLDKFGRKWGVACYTTIFAVGLAMQTAAQYIPLLVVGYLFAGIGVGGNSSIIPIYMAEWYVDYSNRPRFT